MNRRQFLGASAAGAGVVLLGARLSGQTLSAEPSDWTPKLPTVKIYQVYVGRTGDIYLSRPKEEIGRMEQYLRKVETKLGDVKFVGGDQVPPTNVDDLLPKLKDADGILLFHLSGHGGDAPLKAMGQIVDTEIPTAVFSQPYSGHGWLFFPRWQKAGKKVALLPTSDWSEIDRAVGLMRVAPHLRQTRIILINAPLGTAAACSAEQVKQKLGAEIVPVTIEETIKLHKTVDLKAAKAEAQVYWISKAKRIVEPSREEIVNSARFYLALRDLMIRERAQAVTSSGCMGDPAKCCLAFSKLNDLGLVGACEGDMDSTLTMLMFRYAFGIPGFITDPVFDTARNALIHFHCTSATKMDGPTGRRLPFTIRNQSDWHNGVSLEVENRVGQPVTCAKFVNLNTMLISTGKIIEVTHNDLGCRTQFVTQVGDARKMFNNWGGGKLDDDVMTLLHRVVFYGDHLQSIKNLGALMGFDVVEET